MPATSFKEAELGWVRQGLDDLLSGAGRPDDAAGAERLGAALLTMAQVPDAGVELAAASLESLEKAGDARAAGVLAALAVLARPPLAEEARAVLERLHRVGVRSPVEEAVGTLQVEEARRVDVGAGQMLAALLRRPGADQVQAALVIVEHDETGGAAIGGSVSSPGRLPSLGGVLRKITGDGGSSVSSRELREALACALARSAEAGVRVSFDLCAAVPILARALTGDAAAFAPVVVDGGHELPVAPGDYDEFEAASEELAGHLGEVCVGDAVIERSGPFVVTTMLDYKWHYGDRRLGSWTTADLDDYLLDYFPRKVSGGDGLVVDTPSCVAAFLAMLDHHGALQGQSLEVLGAHVEALREEFAAAAEDRRRWGLAKSTMMMMLDAGVDPEDPDSVQDWIDAVNAGPLLFDGDRLRSPRGDGRFLDGPARVGRTQRAARTKQRKAARAARRRNRH